MTDQLFDKFIRDKLGDYSSPVPGDMWQRISGEEKRRGGAAAWLHGPRLYLWLAALLLLVSGGSWLWYRQTANTQHLSNTNNTTVSNNNSTLPSSGNNGNNDNGAATNGAAAQQQATAANSSGAATSAASAAAGNNNNNGWQEQQAYNNNPAYHNRHNLASNYLSLPQQADLFNSNETAASSAGLNTALQDAGAMHLYNLEGEAPVLLNNFNSSLQNLALKQLLNKQANKKLPIIQCPPMGGPFRNDFYVELYASPDYVMKSVTPNSYTAGNYLQRKDSAESMRVSFSVGARFSKSLSEHLLAKAGFQYSQVNERLTTQTESERKTVTVITTHTIVNSPGDTVIVHDTSSYEQIGYRKKTVANKYKSIDIPLILSYEWGNDQWKFAANAGAIVNLYSWYSGEVLDTSMQAVSVNNKGTQGVYKHNIGLGLYAGFSVMKSISENMELFAEPYFRYNFSNMTQPGQVFNQKFKTAGLSLGIRYKLNSGQRFR